MRSWRKTFLRFGMVAVPVNIAPAKVSGAEYESHKFANGERVKQAWTDGVGNLLPTDDIVRAYEVGGHVVEVEAPELPGETGIDLRAIVPAASVDPVLYDAAYAVWPSKGGERPFAALAAAVEDRGPVALVGVARFTDRPRDCVVRYCPATDSLTLHTLTFAGKLRAAEIRAEGDKLPDADPADVSAAETFLDSLPTEWTPTERDPMDDAVRDALAAAVPGIFAPVEAATTDADLLASLRAGGVT